MRLSTTQARLVADVLSHKLKTRDKWETSKVDSQLEEMRHLLVKDRSLGEVLTALQQLRISGFEELREQQENNWKLLEIRRKISRGEGLGGGGQDLVFQKVEGDPNQLRRYTRNFGRSPYLAIQHASRRNKNVPKGILVGRDEEGHHPLHQKNAIHVGG